MDSARAARDRELIVGDADVAQHALHRVHLARAHGDVRQGRIDTLFQRMWLHLGTAAALLLVLLSVVFFVARQIALPILRLCVLGGLGHPGVQ